MRAQDPRRREPLPRPSPTLNRAVAASSTLTRAKISLAAHRTVVVKDEIQSVRCTTHTEVCAPPRLANPKVCCRLTSRLKKIAARDSSHIARQRLDPPLGFQATFSGL